jgi:hypothetical protein
MEQPFDSSGPLRYSYEADYGYKLIVEVDPEIARLARYFVPKSVPLRKPRYEPHITVVRREVPPHLEHWGCDEGRVVEFEYEPFLYHDESYWWLRVFSDDLAAVRQRLGLVGYGRTSVAPDLKRCYHTTIGNLK